MMTLGVYFLFDKGVSLTSARSQVKKLAKAAENNFVKKQSSSYQLMQVLVKKLGTGNVEGVHNKAVEMMKALTDAIASLSLIRSDVDNWGKETYLDKHKEFMVEYGKSESLNDDLVAVETTLRGVRVDEVRAGNADSRRNSLKLVRVFKKYPLAAQGCPAPLVSYIGANILNFYFESMSPAVKTSSLVVKPSAGSEVDLSKVLLWPAIENHVAELSGVLAGAELMTVAKASEALKKHMAKNATVACNLVRLTQEKGDVQALAAWIPKLWSSAPVSAEMSSSGGVPILFSSRQYGYRGNQVLWPLWGVGCLMHCTQGEYAIATFSVDEVVDCGSTPHDVNAMFCGLTPTDARKWMDQHGGPTVQLVEGNVVWLPYGTLAYLVGVAEVNNVVTVPIFSRHLLTSMTDKARKALSAFTLGTIKAAKENAPFTLIGTQLKNLFERD